MATYTLTPRLIWVANGTTITTPTYAYTDVNSTTFAEIFPLSYLRPVYLGEFDFSNVANKVTNIVVKIKIKGNSSTYVRLYSSENGVALSSSTALSSSAKTYTLTLTSTAETIAQYANSLCIKIYRSSSTTNVDVYGATITVTTDDTPARNKVVFGENSLINLSTDTVGRANVAKGVRFHLPNGVQTTGTSPAIARTTLSGSSIIVSKTMAFSVGHEPSSFLVIICSTTMSLVDYIYYDGTTVMTYYLTTSSGSSRDWSTTYTSFSYSSGTLTLTTTNSNGFGHGGDECHIYYA